MIKLIKVISTRFYQSYFMTKFLGMGKDDVQETKTATPYGFDSNPIKDIIGIQVQTTVNGENVVIGFIGKNGITEPGESRMFSTDDNGNLKIDLHVKKDGTIHFGGENGNLVRYQELKQEYDKTKDVVDTILNILRGSPIPEPGNGANSALQSALSGALAGKSTGDISGAKIDELKTL